MSEKRYFKVEYDEEWYLFDSTTISEQLVKEQAEYGYGVFANSLSPSEIVGLLNEQQDKITELEKNFEDLVNWSSEIAKRNVVLDEQLGQLQRENEQLKNKLNKGL